jgi:hypothetical protein
MNYTTVASEVPQFSMKELVLPPSGLEIAGILILMVMTFLSNVGGLGGGGTLTPVMLIFFGLSI